MSDNKWQSRIIGHGEEAPEQLLANSANWRIHPKHQQDALSTVLDKIGWIQDVIVNQRTNTVIDGHLRVQLAISQGEASIPVVYVDLTEDEERLALATLDSTSHMAVTDGAQLTALLKDIQAGDESLVELVNSVAVEMGVIPGVDYQAEWQGMPEFEQDDLTAFKSIIVHFDSMDNVSAFANLIGQPITEKTRSLWYPEAVKTDMYTEAYRDES